MPLSGSWFGRRWDFTRAALEYVERNDNCAARKTRLESGKLYVTHYLQRLVIARDWEPKHQTRPKATASWTNEHLEPSLRKHSARAQRPNEQKKSLPIRIYFVFLKFLKFLKNTNRKAANATRTKWNFPWFLKISFQSNFPLSLLGFDVWRLDPIGEQCFASRRMRYANEWYLNW